MKKMQTLMAIFWLLVLFLLPLEKSFSAPLPKATQKLLEQFNLSSSLLANIDQELEMPKEWIEKAKANGKLRIRSTPARPSELRTLLGPFKERYPFIEIEFSGTNQQTRSVKTLMAYKSGRILADFMTSIGGFIHEYKAAGALVDLSDVPNVQRIGAKAKDPSGLWTGINSNFWCMSYNTRLVKKQDLPKKWEDLITNPKWRGGNLALGNRPQLVFVALWAAKGEKWTKNFITRLFTEVKPQLRKEGMNVLPQLTAAGEFHGAMPSNNKRPYQLKLDGAPIGFTCPEPVPASTEDAVILRGGNVPTAKVFLNWLLSIEGQIAQYAFEYATPLSDELRAHMLPFRDQILGREESFRNREFEMKVMPDLSKFWSKLWLSGGGAPRRRRR